MEILVVLVIVGVCSVLFKFFEPKKLFIGCLFFVPLLLIMTALSGMLGLTGGGVAVLLFQLTDNLPLSAVVGGLSSALTFALVYQIFFKITQKATAQFATYVMACVAVGLCTIIGVILSETLIAAWFGTQPGQIAAIFLGGALAIAGVGATEALGLSKLVIKAKRPPQ